MLKIQKRLSNSFYAILSLPSTAMGFALSVQISALSWILSTKYNLDIHDVGLVWAAGPIAGILGQVVIGIISDKVWFLNGRRRPFILIGGFLAALMLLALPNIDIISAGLGIDGILGVAIVVALTLDLAINVSFNPTRSIIADVTPEGPLRTKGYTWMQTVSGTFGVLAYGIGAVWGNYFLIYSGAILVLALSLIPPFFIEEPRQLKNSASDDKQTSTNKTSLLEIFSTLQPLLGFLVYSIYAIIIRLGHFKVENYYMEIFCLILTAVLIFLTLIRSEKGENKTQAGLIGFKKVLAAHSFTWIGIQTMFVYMFAYVQYKVFGLKETEEIPKEIVFEMGQIVSVSFLIFNAIAAILPALVLEPLARRLGRVRTHAFSLVTMSVGYAGILLFGFNATIIYIMMTVLGIGWAATVSLPFAIMSQKVEQSKMGLYMGIFNLSVVLPQLVASLGIGEAISKAEDKSLIFIISTATLAVSAILWFTVKEPKDSGNTNMPVSGGH